MASGARSLSGVATGAGALAIPNEGKSGVFRTSLLGPPANSSGLIASETDTVGEFDVMVGGFVVMDGGASVPIC